MSAVRQVFFDLDGTLVDASDRLFGLFRKLVPQCSFDKSEYWARKRSGQDHRKILVGEFGYDEPALARFERKWLAEIESEESLSIDVPYAGTRELLETLRGKGLGLWVVTARQRPDAARAELARFGLFDLLDGLIVTGLERPKSAFILERTRVGEGDVLVGDTERDVRTAREIGATACAVTYGFRERRIVEGAGPEIVANSVEELSAWLLNSAGGPR